MQGSEKINEILLNLGIKAPTFAKRIGVKYQRILDIQNGKVKKISGELANHITNTYPQFDINWLLTGEGSMLKDNNNGATQTDNNSTNPTNTQAKMDPLTMDYISTLKEQLAVMTAIVKNQTAVIERLSQKGDDEVLSRRLGAVEEKRDELTDKP